MKEQVLQLFSVLPTALASAMVIGVIVVVAIIAAVVGLFVLFLGITMWEKQPIKLYSETDKPDGLPTTKDARIANAAAAKLNFTHVAVYSDPKGHTPARYDVWLSHDEKTLGVVTAGKLMGVDVDALHLYSMREDGHVYCTRAGVAGSEISGVIDQLICSGFGFESLVTRHNMRTKNQELVPVSGQKPIDLIEEIHRIRADALVDRGYAKYVDPERTWWRYTLRGAFVLQVMPSLGDANAE